MTLSGEQYTEFREDEGQQPLFLRSRELSTLSDGEGSEHHLNILAIIYFRKQ